MDDNLLTDIREKAMRAAIPVMDEDSLYYIRDFIGNYHIEKMLEVGTAVGYSASVIASYNPSLQIVTLEKDEERYQQAVKNIALLNLENQIQPVLTDALEYETDELFDMILLDGPKAHNRELLEKYEKNLKPHGYFIIDDVYFHGYIEHPEVIRTRRLRTLVTRFSEFIEYMKTNPDYECTYLGIGDGLLIAQRRR